MRVFDFTHYEAPSNGYLWPKNPFPETVILSIGEYGNPDFGNFGELQKSLLFSCEGVKAGEVYAKKQVEGPIWQVYNQFLFFSDWHDWYDYPEKPSDDVVDKSRQIYRLKQQTLSEEREIHMVSSGVYPAITLCGLMEDEAYDDEFVYVLNKDHVTCAECLREISRLSKIVADTNAGQSSKPPIGLIPLWRWNEIRKEEVRAAIERYKEVGKEVPTEWYDELKQCVSESVEQAYEKKYPIDPEMDERQVFHQIKLRHGFIDGVNWQKQQEADQ